MKLRVLCIICIIFTLCGFTWQFPNFDYPSYQSSKWVGKKTNLFKVEGLRPDILKLSLDAYNYAKQKGLTNKQFLTIIDYSKSSTEKRLWVLDLVNGRALFNTWVSHGRNSGGLLSHSFSNQPGSLKSSIGVFLTDHPYFGGNGYSLRLRGLEHGVNDNAYGRAVVLHGARYVNSSIIRQYGQIGRSWGCPAVSLDLVKSIINTIKDKTLLVAYYPDRNWLSHSRFLTN